jgi:hypothetical protein
MLRHQSGSRPKANRQEGQECEAQCKLRIFAFMRALKTFLAALFIAASLSSATSCKSADLCPTFVGDASKAEPSGRV